MEALFFSLQKNLFSARIVVTWEEFMGNCKIRVFEISPYIRGDFVYENINYAYRGDLFSASFIIENLSQVSHRPFVKDL